MKKSIKLLGMAAATMLVVVACKSKPAEPIDSLDIDTLEMVAPIETPAEDTIVAEVEQVVNSTKKAATKASTKVEEKKTATAKSLNVSGKQDVKDASRNMKEGEGNSVEQKELNTKKDARSAFRNR